MNFNLVVDTSNYKPFSFQEKIAPLLIYKDAYDKQQEKMEKYSELLADLRPDLFKNENYRSEIQGFNDAFREASDSFSKGMTRENMSMLNNLFIRDKANMKKYQDAIKLYNADIEKRITNGDDFESNVGPGVDGYVGLKAADIKNISKDKLYTKGEKGAKGLFNSLKQLGKAQFTDDLMNGYQFYSQQNDDVGQALQLALNYATQKDIEQTGSITEDTKKAYSAVNDYINTVLSSSGATKENGFSDESMSRMYNAVVSGLVAGYDRDIELTKDLSHNYAIENSTYTFKKDENGIPIAGYNLSTDIGRDNKREIDDQHNHTKASTAAANRSNTGGSGGESSTNKKAVKNAILMADSEGNVHTYTVDHNTSKDFTGITTIDTYNVYEHDTRTGSSYLITDPDITGAVIKEYKKSAVSESRMLTPKPNEEKVPKNGNGHDKTPPKTLGRK